MQQASPFKKFAELLKIFISKKHQPGQFRYSKWM